MALPKLNETIRYEIEIPSTGKTIKYRPYLVKEEKVLLTAFESGDQKQTLETVVDTIEACVYSKLQRNKLTTFDIEYLFMQIRSKSVGEISTVGLSCSECDTVNEIQVDVSEVVVKKSESVDNTIDIVDNIKVRMRYPSFLDLAYVTSSKEDKNDNDVAFDLLSSCVEAVITDDEEILAEDESKEAMREFVESMTTGQISKLTEFMDSVPKVAHDVSFTCQSCGSLNTKTIEGMQNFF
jgi:hypothetical protein